MGERGVQISIVLPVYNGENYLRDAIDSVLRQTFEDWELIIVDDCSTDGSPSIMEEYRQRDGRIRVINNNENKKLPKSLNIGFASATGKYYTWTSDDNMYKPQALEEMYWFLESHGECGLVYADMDLIDGEGIKTGFFARDEGEIYSGNCVGACFLYRSEDAREIGEYDDDMILVEDYDYWLRFAKRYSIRHLPLCLYEYRNHGGSLTQKRQSDIAKQLGRLRRRELDFLLANAAGSEKERLFLDMWQHDDGSGHLKEKFWGGGSVPDSLKWIERKRGMDESKKVILFGAGAYGEKAFEYFGGDKVAFYADNNPEVVGSKVNGKDVISFSRLVELKDEYQVVISVDARKVPEMTAQLEDGGITDYVAYIELTHHLKRPSADAVDWVDVCKKARGWIERNSIPNSGIICNSAFRSGYPEVTGYYIPTLMRWGFSDLAKSYARWLCSIQREDGAWLDAMGEQPYVFDTAQILKGLLSVRGQVAGADAAIRKGCDWVISNIGEDGRLTTPTKEAWGEEGVCSELIHIYCLSPLYEAAEAYGEPIYREAAKKAEEYYISEHIDDIKNFNILSHFYAYVMEGLCDIGRDDLARESMRQLEDLLDEKGYVPAYRDVEWVCSTGMFQLAVVWFKLGDLEHGERALCYAARLQNESGGWYGSYPVIDNPRASDRKEWPDYFADAEISWAAKYMLDAVYLRNKLQFEQQASGFPDSIARDDGRYRLVLDEIKMRGGRKVLDVGCGKGRYLRNLKTDYAGAAYCGIDLSAAVMDGIQHPIEKRVGIMTQIPYGDEAFDVVYAAESLEHSVFPNNAIREMLRVTAPGGEVVIIDKNAALQGLLEMDEWEQWFDDAFFERVAEEEECDLRIIKNVQYDGIADGLFSGWVFKKGG